MSPAAFNFSKIQKNRDGSTKGINSNVLRKGIESALAETLNNTIEINKIQVAQSVVSQSPSLNDKELNKELNRLINFIRKANKSVSF